MPNSLGLLKNTLMPMGTTPNSCAAREGNIGSTGFAVQLGNVVNILIRRMEMDHSSPECGLVFFSEFVCREF